MNEDFGVGRRPSNKPAKQPASQPTHSTSNASTNGPRHRMHYATRDSGPARDKVTTAAGTLASGAATRRRPASAANDEFSVDLRDSAIPSDLAGITGKQAWYRRITDKLTRKQWLILLSVLVLLIAGLVSFLLTRPDAAPANQAVSKAKPKPAPAPPAPPVSPLTGADVTDELAKRPVIGVMIENSPASRPQSGLNQAGVIFEAIAEYGITRFLALYQEGQPTNLGPVRSVRPYYVDWTKTFDAPIAHVGGSPDALAKIKNEGVRDLDQFANGGAYRRINTRQAPHNMYTTMKQLDELSAGKGWTSSKFTSLARKKAAPAAATARTANTVNIAISGPTYDVSYTYDVDNNRYLRTMGGVPHVDADSQERIAPKVVIGLVTPYGLEANGFHSRYQTTGTGIAVIFQDGIATQVNWSKPAATDQYTFTDPSGKAFKLIPGQTWITAVGSLDAISFAP